MVCIAEQVIVNYGEFTVSMVVNQSLAQQYTPCLTITGTVKLT
jgi:hypothetical protein